MLVVLLYAVSILIALARGGQPNRFLDLNIRFFYLLFAPLLLQLIIFSPLGASIAPGVPVVYLVSMLVAALVVALNLQVPGFPLLLLGLLSNLLVIAVNGGYMPVSMGAREFAGMPAFTGTYNNVIEMTSATPLWFLSDLFPTPRALPFANVFSIGDLLITLGGIIFIQRTLVPPRAHAA
ncbi:MAG: DUF5317 domain-containing protein [Chloroflexi bacterium]|nr:DUF5317 domain-containing protein [Chloroflexota bacterium]